MSIEQFENQLRAEAPAVHFLSDSIAEFLLNRGHAVKIGEIVSQVGKRVGANAKLVRQTLTMHEQFVGEERRWNLSIRTAFHRPIEGALQHTLRLYGKPMSIMAFSNEMAVLNARAPEYFQAMLPGFLAARPQTYFQAPDGNWGLREWLLDMSTTDEEELLQRNFFYRLPEQQPLIDEIRKVKLTAKMSPVEMAEAVLRAVGRALDTRLLSYAVWRVQKDDFDPLGFYLTLLNDERFHLFSGGEWVLNEQLENVNSSLQKLSAMADVALEEEETWEGPYVVTPEDKNEVFDFLIEQAHPLKLSDVIDAVFEYSPSSPRYPSVYEALMAEMQGDSRFQLVGRQTWTLPALIPQEVLQVPEVLLPEIIDPSLLPEPDTDAELEDEGLENNLPLWVHDPRYEDFGGEHEVELSPEDITDESLLNETRIPLLYNHRRMGTLKLRQADMAFFPTDTPLACVSVESEKFGPFQIWINNDELLIHGLADWYQARQVPVGAMLTFTRGNELDEYRLSWSGEMDELITIPEERINVLQEMHDAAEVGNWSVYEIMRNVLAGHPEGIHFLTLWAELNVVRRTPKRVVASNLSSYHCFVLISGSERWRLDERKVEQGRKKTKKKFIIE